MKPYEPIVPEAAALATLLHLGRRARQARDATELGFVAVNETHALTPYRQAALWLEREGVAALSGVVAPEENAPYLQWLRRLARVLREQQPAECPSPVNLAQLSAPQAAEWADWLPGSALWVPLPPVAPGFAGGALLLARDAPWSDAEQGLLAEWAAIWAQAMALRRRGAGRWRATGVARARPAASLRRLAGALRHPLTWLLAAAVACTFVTVPLTVLSPAELVPLQPALVRSPLDGVVDRVLVVPNQRVRKDDVLFEFDRAALKSRLEVAMRTLGTVRAEYRQKAQLALVDPASKAQLAVLQGQIAEKGAEVAYLRKLSERGVVVSPRDGIVLFDDPTEWIGRPVVTGERVMVVADEHAVEVEAWLSPGDAIPLAAGAPLSLHMHADPGRPLPATLRYLAHEAVERPDGGYAYRVRATLAEDEERPRVGLKGTARIEGERVSIAYWMLRRPLASARAWLGL